MNNEKGFTVIELTLATALIALLLLPIFSVFLSNQKNVISSNARVDIQDKAQQVMYAFRNECLYTKKVKECTINGSNGKSLDKTDGKSFKIKVTQPADPNEITKTYVYDAGQHKFNLLNADNSSMLEVADVTVNLWPVVKDGDDLMFGNAIGLEVEVSLSQEDERLSKKTELVALSNSFYFRNADANIKLISRTPSPKGATISMPTPISIGTH